MKAETLDIHGLTEITPGGHLDEMVRQTRIHHMQLSQMADVKASMMLTLASLIITFSIGYLEDPLLRWPVLVMLLFCVITIMAAAYAVMPKLNINSAPKPNDPNFNILFFGSFMNMNYDEYTRHLNEIVHEPTRVYELQLREIYQQGLYLGRKKYRFIRIAYTAFLTGLVLSMITLVVIGSINLETL